MLPPDAVIDEMRLRRALEPGMSLAAANVEPRPPVARSEQVMVRVVQGAVTIETTATALADARVGEIVKVKNPNTNESYVARVVGPGTVVVGARCMMMNMLNRLLLVGACCVAGIAAAQSLYDEASFQSLTADRRAVKPGDVLTVLVIENSSASASANTTTSKSSSLNGGAKGSIVTAGGTTGAAYSGALSLGEDFGGKGVVQRAGRVAAQITVTVQSVAPNRDLFVSGRQQLLVNGEKQLIELSGRVRGIDISESNTVPSNRIADAHIVYVGDGILAEKQKQGILARILDWMGLL